MKMKRWISILLTLALCLCLLPSTILATESETSIGLKLTTDEAGNTEIAANSDGSYTVNYAVNEETVVYLCIIGDDAVGFAEDTASKFTPKPISAKLSADKKVLTITHGTGDASGCSVETILTVGTESIDFKISFVPEGSRDEETDPVDTCLLYDDNGVYEFVKPAGSKFGFPPYIDVNGTKTKVTPDAGYEFYCDEAVGMVDWDSATGGGELSWSVANVADTVSGKIYAKHTNGTIYSCSVTVVGTGGNLGDGEDEPMLKTGIYTTLSDKQLSGFIEMTQINGGAYGYNITYVSGKSVTIYYYRPDHTCSSTSEDIQIADVAAEEVGGLTGVQSITLVSGKTGTISVDVSSKDSSGNGPIFPIVFTDGSAQLYNGNETAISERAGNDCKLNLILKTHGQSDIAVDKNYKISCVSDTPGKSIGAVEWYGENLVWDLDDAIPGATGYIQVSMGDETYTIPVSVRVPVVGVYENTDYTGYIVKTNGATVVDSSKTQTVYICIDTSFDRQFIEDEVSVDGKNVVGTATFVNKKTIKVSLNENQSGLVVVSVKCPVQSANGQSTEDWSYSITFDDGTALYNDQGNVLTLRNEVGGRRTFQLYYGETPTLVPANATVSLSSGSLGTIKAADDAAQSGNWIWVAEAALPNACGKLNVTIDGKTYSCDVTIAVPVYGLYSKAPLNGDYSGYIPRINGKSTVNFASNESKTVYLYIGNSNISFNTTGFKSDNEVVTVERIGDKMLAVTLAADNSGTIDTLITCPATDGGSTQNWDYRIVFNDGTALYDDQGNVLTLNNDVGGMRTFHLYYGEKLTKVPVDAKVEFTNSGLGIIKAATGDALNDGNWVWIADNVLPNASGKLNVTIDGKIYSCDATINIPMYGLYSKDPSNGDYSGYIPKDGGKSTVSFTSNGSQTVYLYIGDSNISFNTTGFKSDSEAVTVKRIGDRVLEITLAANNTGTINTLITCPATNEPNWDYRIIFNDGDGTDTDSDGNQGDSSGNVLIKEAHTLLESEIYSGERINEHMGEFTLPGDGNKYYMVPSMPASSFATDHPHLNGESSSYDAQTNLMFIEFWVGLGQNNYTRVKDSATLDKIKKAFSDSDGKSTLKMELLAATYPFYQLPLPKDYPATYTTTEVDAWRQPIKAKFDFGSTGTWVYCASGTINGKLVTAEVRSTILFGGDIIWSPDTTSGVDVINQVNDYLKMVELPDNFGLIVNLPAGEYHGYITVPSRLSDDGISINGVYDEGAGTFSTILHGGVQGENRRTHVSGIRFIGAGKNVRAWGGDTVNSGRPNYAYYGSCGGNFGECIFENFDCAVMSSYEIKTGTNSQFKNNYTAICYNTTEFAGIGASLKDNLYEDNGVAIHFAQFSRHVGLTILGISGSWFINNDVDIRNDLGRNLFVPGNYFAAKGPGDTDVLRECRSISTENQNRRNQVHTYPQAANRQFTEWMYRRDFYKFTPSINASFAATYKVPVEYLDNMTFAVMNDDEALAIWTFGSSGEEEDK